ncbi:hypothetical protein, partial [Planktotalea frisia]|uniref:hypothetical protein n=1 Tax=Planktotalea frisia TaxID=696762 RepID=UPI0023575217
PCAKKDLQKGSHPHRTKRPCAAAAIADAAFARNRGDDFLAVQRFSPKQPFKRVNRAGSQTVFSLQVV